MTRKVDSHFTILLTSAPAGRFLEGYLTDAGGSDVKPGHGMQIDVSEDEVGGRKFWEPYGGTSGHRKLIAILLENELIGKTCEDGIEDGQKIRMYCPIPGDELLVRVSATGTGTGDSLAVGDKLILANGGTFIKTTGTPEAEPFEVMEVVDDVTSSGDLVHVIFTGN